MGMTPAPAAWSPLTRVLFRFAFVYLVLFNLPFPLQYIPVLEKLVRPSGELFSQQLLQPYEDLWNWLVPWVGQHVFGVEITVRPNGSGDTTYNYVQDFCFLVLSVGATILWTLLDWKRSNYERLHQWLRVYVRFSLALIMMSYGDVKIIKAQFPNPSLDRLLQPFGDASPMGLLWTFMGASVSYNIFAGLGETLGGLLLTMRRTTLLGALVCIGVLSNIVMMNFSYDVPVKLFSSHLLAMAIFLVVPDAGRLANLFLLNRPAEPVIYYTFFSKGWLDLGVRLTRTALVLVFLAFSLHGAYQSSQKFGDLAPKSPLYGVWNVEEFEIDGKIRPPLVSNSDRWRRVVFDYPMMAGIQLMSDRRQRYLIEIDTNAGTLAFSKRGDPAWKSKLSYQKPSDDTLLLEGTFDGRPLHAKLHLADAAQFQLLNRGFHWINEYPFNQ